MRKLNFFSQKVNLHLDEANGLQDCLCKSWLGRKRYISRHLRARGIFLERRIFQGLPLEEEFHSQNCSSFATKAAAKLETEVRLQCTRSPFQNFFFTPGTPLNPEIACNDALVPKKKLSLRSLHHLYHAFVLKRSSFVSLQNPSKPCAATVLLRRVRSAIAAGRKTAKRSAAGLRGPTIPKIKSRARLGQARPAVQRR